MPRPASIAISAGLIVSGALACGFTTRTLVQNPELAFPLNPMGINGSPYGEVFAMAMQSPIDDYFHLGTGGEIHRHAPGETCKDHEEHAHDEHAHEEHVHDENCKHEHHQDDHNVDTQASSSAKPEVSLSPINRFRDLLVSLSRVREVRTNPKAASENLKLHLRRETENKLRFAYHLDPSHYGNYNSLHFFLTEPKIGTRPHLSASAATLAQETIDYCLKKNDDPRAALTAAAAAGNILELMFIDRLNPTPKFTTTQMRDVLKVLDHCLARYQILSKHWDETQNWQLLSPMRIAEAKDRLQFITKVREAAQITLANLEPKT